MEDSSSAHFRQARRTGLPPDGISPVEGLRMSRGSRDFPHRPVMVEEVRDLFREVPAGLVVDATVGGGGHAVAILDAHRGVRILGIDRDPLAVAAARKRLRPYGDRAVVRRGRFDTIDEILEGLGPRAGAPLVGVLFDLGVSSPQLDTAQRGFSFRADAPLDMRMDPSRGASAADLVNALAVDELTRIFVESGEGRFARRLARAIAGARPVTSTHQLVAVVESAIPASVRPRRGHPARRVFQALRIAVNEELSQLRATLPSLLPALAEGGRCVVLSYHSGEDRIVKSVFTEAVSGGCHCPPGLPCVCGAEPLGRFVVRGARRPSPAEVAANPRSAQARLRAFERLGAAGRTGSDG